MDWAVDNRTCIPADPVNVKRCPVAEGQLEAYCCRPGSHMIVVEDLGAGAEERLETRQVYNNSSGAGIGHSGMVVEGYSIQVMDLGSHVLKEEGQPGRTWE